jgi:hypothetical protein
VEEEEVFWERIDYEFKDAESSSVFEVYDVFLSLVGSLSSETTTWSEVPQSISDFDAMFGTEGLFENVYEFFSEEMVEAFGVRVMHSNRRILDTVCSKTISSVPSRKLTGELEERMEESCWAGLWDSMKMEWLKCG